VLVQMIKLACSSFPPRCNDVVPNAFVHVEEGKVACTSFPPWWDGVQDALVIVQVGKLAHTSFPQRWNDVVQDTLSLLLMLERKLTGTTFLR